MFVKRTISAHLRASAARKAPTPSGDVRFGSTLNLARLCLAAADLSPSLITPLSRPINSGGVPGGCQHPGPERQQIVGITAFDHGRDVGKVGATRRAGDGERAHLAAADVRKQRPDRSEE